MIRRWAIYALLAAVAGLSGMVALGERRKAVLAAENERLTRSVAALTEGRRFSERARLIEVNRAQDFAERARELDATIETILTGGIPDAVLDPRLADALNGLRNAD